MLALNSESSYKANFVSKRAVFAFYSVSVKKKCAESMAGEQNRME